MRSTHQSTTTGNATEIAAPTSSASTSTDTTVPSGRATPTTSPARRSGGTATSTTPPSSNRAPSLTPSGTRTCTTPKSVFTLRTSPGSGPAGRSTTGALAGSNCGAGFVSSTTSTLGVASSFFTTIIGVPSSTRLVAMTCRPFFCEVFTVSSPARATKDTLPSGRSSTPQSARASASFSDSRLTVSPLAMASFTTFENLEEFVWSVSPALSASMCRASQPMHFPITTPSFHATRLTEMAFLVSQRLQVYTNVKRSDSGTWTRATLLGSSSPKPLPPAISEVERVRWSGVKAAAAVVRATSALIAAM
ncbi:unnamed protein product [Pelagomonas calceolata]|uniref:Uncharacterized protein n=1 Tax=Pelagomonas calceolata TaxID=35677 RepID=A0A8J2WRC5_9STRA|nr:unnamed protein product [Pelagomonas calceolata]|mmetsp:Transcript_3769/g.10699  ORF Transcript_3769/g.10699 Transcript_3769/m.10699 type:complete len:306 (+) Transcript_3769:277-1194(+)